MKADEISFSDCPYNCNNGKVYNQATRQFVDCPHCSKKRKIQYNEAASLGSKDANSVEKALRVPKSYTGAGFDFASIFRSKDYKEIYTPQSLSSLNEETTKLINAVTLGEAPEYSVAFNFGFRANVFSFIYPFLVKSYLGGLRTAPLVTGFDLSKMRLEAQTSFKLDETSDIMVDLRKRGSAWGDCYENYIDADICLVLLDAAATVADVSSVRGLMMHRAIKGKATVIVLDCYIHMTKQLLVDYASSRSFDLASLVTIQLSDFAMSKLAIDPNQDGYFAHSISEDEMNNLSTIDGFTESGTVKSPVKPNNVMTERQFSDLFKVPDNLL